MEDRITIRGDKVQSKQIRWLQKGASKEKARPVLTGICVDNGNSISADGYRIHAIPTPEALEDADGRIIEGNVPAGDFVADMTEIEGVFPDAYGILPNDEVELRIVLDPKFLRDALQYMACPVRLVFRGPHKPVEVYGQDKDDNPMYALIMPFYGQDDDSDGWRPCKEHEQDESDQAE